MCLFRIFHKSFSYSYKKEKLIIHVDFEIVTAVIPYENYFSASQGIWDGMFVKVLRQETAHLEARRSSIFNR